MKDKSSLDYLEKALLNYRKRTGNLTIDIPDLLKVLKTAKNIRNNER